MAIPKRKVVSLIRVSSLDQAADDRTGIRRQLEDIEIHCRTQNLEITKKYELQGISGAYVQRSPQFREMLSKLSQVSIAGIVFASLDRFFRPENLSAYQVFGPFESTGKHLFCDLGELDPKNQQDQMKIVLWGQMAGMERTRIRDRMVRGKEFKRLDPCSRTDPLPKGVVFIPGANGNPGKFAYTDDAQRVREAFRRVLKGETIQAIADDLKFGSATALRITLKSHWWIGVKASTKRRDYGPVRKTRTDGSLADGRKVERTTPIVVPTNLANRPLVSPSDFEAVQQILKANTKTWTQRKSRENSFLGTGLLYCQCGLKMYHKLDSRPGKPSYYICASRWNNKKPCGNPSLKAVQTDGAIWWSVMTYFTDEKFITAKIREMMTTEGRVEKQQMVERIEKLIDQLEAKLRRAVDFSLEHPEYIERVKKLKAEIATEQLNLGKAQSELLAHLEEKDIKRLAKRIKERFWGFDTWPMPERKTVMAEYIRKITIDAEGQADFVVRIGLPAPPWQNPGRRYEHFRESMIAIAGRDLEHGGEAGPLSDTKSRTRKDTGSSPLPA